MKRAFFIFLRALLFIPFFVLYTTVLRPENENETLSVKKIDPPYYGYSSKWVDSVFNSLTPDQRIGQLFMVPAYTQKEMENSAQVSKLIREYHVGGVIFFKGGPVCQAQQTNYYQLISKTPLMVAIDGEWGLAMRLDSTISYPKQMMLGAIQDEGIIYAMGLEIARQCRRIGINVNFAPVLDINNNRANPVIGYRSFGENQINVARKGFAYMIGLQDKKVLTTGKHFPGHGDTDSDSHKTLPVINHTRNRLDSLELFPFRELINAGLGGVMVGHLFIPALDSTVNQPSSLSESIITGILRNELGFKGLIFTDGLGMKGVTMYNKPGVTDVKALIAGVDVLLMSEDVPLAFAEIKKAIADGLITQEEIDIKCKRIIQAKQWLELDKYKPVEIKNIHQDLNSGNAKLIYRKLVEAALTLVKNTDNLIPFRKLDSTTFASIVIGNGSISKFQKSLDLYTKFSHFQINKSAMPTDFDLMVGKLAKYNVVVVGIKQTSQYPNNYGITQQTIDFISKLSEKTNVVLTVFASPYSLSNFKNLDKVKSILVSYEENVDIEDLSAQLLFGGIPARGKLPISIDNYFKYGTGVTDDKIRLKYSIPEELEINPRILKKIDSVIQGAIELGAMPGCQVLAAKDGIVFYHKAFGYLTYEKNNPVDLDNLYDLASLTKIIATAPTLMKLYEENKFDLNKKISDYLTDLKGTNKQNLKIIDVLTHQAQLPAWIPFFLKTYVKGMPGSLRTDLYRSVPNDTFSMQVAQNIYLNKYYLDTIYKRIYECNLLTKKKYKYSDLGYYFFYRIIDTLTHKTIDKYTEDFFYKKLGAGKLCYNPLRQFPKNTIAPTEDDLVYRKQRIQGFVHDYGAAMFGGIGCHAGLFSNANDLAKILQMYLQNGYYGGENYFKAETIKLFTSKPVINKKNRRGLCFDRPGANGEGPACSIASLKSYGHTGFTGTMVWVDPEYQFVYIFLSNRVHPNIENEKIRDLNLRSAIHRLFYEAILLKS